MDSQKQPIDIGIFNQLNLSPAIPPEEEKILSQIKAINWNAVPFCRIEVRVRNGKPHSVVLEKTYTLK